MGGGAKRPLQEASSPSLLNSLLDNRPAAKRSRRWLDKGSPRADPPRVDPTPASAGNPRGPTGDMAGDRGEPEDVGGAPSGVNGAILTTDDFYGNLRDRVEHVEQQVLRILAGARKHSMDPYRIFSRQQPAFDWADNVSFDASRMRIFSMEKVRKGKDSTRVFIATTYDEFWKRYQKLRPTERHHYEIIREGSPCHLYFDLEFQRIHNEGVDGQKMVDDLIALVSEALKDKFNIKFDPTHCIELDSSTATKFSRHLIVGLPGCTFKNNIHAGAFARHVCEMASKEKILQVTKEDGSSTLLVDMGVYTRNRAFRLMLSSKAGKNSILNDTGRFRAGNLNEKEVFMASLIGNVDNGHRLTMFDDEDNDRGANGQQPNIKTLRNPLGNTSSRAPGEPRHGPSPFPHLDAFLASISNQGGSQGSIRSWMSMETGDVILYNIRDNRWCGNIGRQHKSNGIFYVVDLQAGHWYQKCYDPDCRHYRSELRPLPQDLWNQVKAQHGP
eukprot:evm.model.scf_298.12 EVM.evm.TU.scf_298.12   scf_298:77793-83662(-)